MVISFLPGEGGDPDFLDAEVVLREGLHHPDLSPLMGNGSRGITIAQRDSERYLCIPGDIDPRRAAEIEEAIWDKLQGRAAVALGRDGTRAPLLDRS